MNSHDRNFNLINNANRKASKDKETSNNPKSRERLISRLQEQAQRNIAYLKKSIIIKFKINYVDNRARVNITNGSNNVSKDIINLSKEKVSSINETHYVKQSDKNINNLSFNNDSQNRTRTQQLNNNNVVTNLNHVRMNIPKVFFTH